MTDKEFSDLIPERNAVVHRKHRVEVFWQITFPLLVGTLLLLAVCGLTIAAATVGDAAVGLWRDISLIWMLAPTILVSILPLALFGAAAYGVIRLIQVVPGFFFRVQKFFEMLSARIQGYSNRLTAPVIRVNSVWAGLRQIWK